MDQSLSSTDSHSNQTPQFQAINSESSCVNVSFALSGKQLPADHGYLLYAAIARATSGSERTAQRGSSPTVREGVEVRGSSPTVREGVERASHAVRTGRPRSQQTR